ncbi:MAG: hypothetical protein CM15mP102_17520 [Flavobacteriales bacterium]|nr:MAG: hypothetical protein CM15mP102_17520 [Flavobacteriales bacterium]
MIQKWIKDGRIGKVSTVYTWTNRPVWAQGSPMPSPDPTQKPDGMDWDLWIGPAKIMDILLAFMPLVGEVIGIMEQVH